VVKRVKLYKIEIDSLEFDTIIGILAHERVSTQRVVVEFSGEYEMSSDFINYVDIRDTIINNMNEKKFELLESALDDTIALIAQNYKELKNIYLKISKPDILDNCNVSVSKKVANN
jgi:dihydroneopterin aldolase